jgi:hypothetical protein
MSSRFRGNDNKRSRKLHAVHLSAAGLRDSAKWFWVDYPFDMGEGDKRAVLGHNAARLLNIPIKVIQS